MCLVSLQFSKLQWMTLWSCLTEPMRTLDCSARWLGHILVRLHDVCPKLHTFFLNTWNGQTNWVSDRERRPVRMNVVLRILYSIWMPTFAWKWLIVFLYWWMTTYQISLIYEFDIFFYQGQELHWQITENLFFFFTANWENKWANTANRRNCFIREVKMTIAQQYIFAFSTPNCCGLVLCCNS